MGAMIKQMMTEGGTLYGYTVEELQPHLNACHGGATVWLRTEAEHMVVHALGCHHEHYHTESGAVCLPLLEMALTDDHPWWACECEDCAAVWAGDRVAV